MLSIVPGTPLYGRVTVLAPATMQVPCFPLASAEPDTPLYGMVLSLVHLPRVGVVHMRHTCPTGRSPCVFILQVLYISVHIICTKCCFMFL